MPGPNAGRKREDDMAKIYAPPAEIGNAPQFDHKKPYQEHVKNTETYMTAVQEWAKKNGKGPEAGEPVKFQVADGYAMYVVFSASPVKLIHLPLFDAYQFQYANRLTAADIREEIRRGKMLHAMFSRPVEATA